MISIKRFQNSKYFYETENDIITVKKFILTRSDAIVTMAICLYLIPMYIWFEIDTYNSNSETRSVTLICILITILALVCFFILCLIALIVKPVIAVFNYDSVNPGSMKEKFPVSHINDFSIELSRSRHGFRIGYSVNHLSLFMRINNVNKIKLVEINDRKHSDELEKFKLLLEERIFKK